jgi:hypothetical protein
MLVSRVSVPRHGEVYDVRFDPQNPNDYTFAPESAGASSRSSSLPSAISRPSSGGDTLSQLERLEALREKGALTQAEFEAQKRKVLAQG